MSIDNEESYKNGVGESVDQYIGFDWLDEHRNGIGEI